MDILTFIAILVTLGTLATIAAFAIRVAECAHTNYLQHNGAARELARSQMNLNLAMQTRNASCPELGDKLKDMLANGV